VTHAIRGLRHLPEYIDAATHDDLLATVSAQPWKDLPGQRRVQFYGYTYDYLSRSIKRTGERIFTHADAEIFDDVVVISLGTPCVMDFEDSASDGTARLLLEPRSALVLAGDARYGWKHGIAAQTTDEWEGRTIQRGRRVSLTFRNLLSA
jgi:alkylated DNA repair dioxygenase AlkB